MRLLLFCVAFAFADAAIAPDRANAADVTVVNVMPAFDRAWQLGLGKSLDERVRLMKQLVFIPNQPAFDAFGEIPLDDVHIAWFLRDVAPFMPQIRAYSKELRRNLPVYTRRFRTAFPDFEQKAPCISCRRCSFSTASRATAACCASDSTASRNTTRGT